MMDCERGWGRRAARRKGRKRGGGRRRERLQEHGLARRAQSGRARTHRLLPAVDKLVQLRLGNLARLLKVDVVVRAHGAALVSRRARRAAKRPPLATLAHARRHAHHPRVALDLAHDLQIGAGVARMTAVTAPSPAAWRKRAALPCRRSPTIASPPLQPTTTPRTPRSPTPVPRLRTHPLLDLCLRMPGMRRYCDDAVRVGLALNHTALLPWHGRRRLRCRRRRCGGSLARRRRTSARLLVLVHSRVTPAALTLHGATLHLLLWRRSGRRRTPPRYAQKGLKKWQKKKNNKIK